MLYGDGTEPFEREKPLMLVKCLKCDAQLQVSSEFCICSRCGAKWPVTRGIPRFFQVPDYYWGEVDREQARELLAQAREGSWVEAVQTRFPHGHQMSIGLLDLQRASWATMLGLTDRSCALDIGSGYGAITHSLSRLVGEVYSVESIPERIEFTFERLRQERIQNVRLIQASATALPFMKNSFDLIVVNGVLEWIGEWDTEGDARSAQIRFLQSINQLLKTDGVLVVGIENRIGYGLFLGNNDHSGLPYTSIVPRPVASLMLRLSSSPHHRTTLNPKKEYRTYTYSERGYRRLLADAGFESMSSFWADPGYNHPYHLIPLSKPEWVRAHFQNQLEHPSPAPHRSWRRALKRAVASTRIMPLTVPDFVLFAYKRPGRTTELDSWIEECLEKTGQNSNSMEEKARPVPWSLSTHPFKPKAVVRLGDPNSSRDFAYVKLRIGCQDDGKRFQSEDANRVKIQDVLRTRASRKIGIPESYGMLDVGNVSYFMESAARGTELSRIVRRAGYFADLSRVERLFSPVFENLLELTEALQQVSGAPVINPDWREIPKEFRDFAELCSAIEQRRYFGKSFSIALPAWTQHGDLSVENISIDQTTGEITVFDWIDMAKGFPPLYDFFELLYSTGYLRPGEEATRFSGEIERWSATFNGIFFCETGFSLLAQNLMLRGCERLKVKPELIPALLIEYLLVRTHYYRGKSPAQCNIHLHLLQSCLEQNNPVFGKFPFRP